MVSNHASINNATIDVQRRLRGAKPKTKIPASVNPPVAAQTLGAIRFEALCGAVVVRVSVVEPLPVTEAGLNLQFVYAGR